MNDAERVLPALADPIQWKWQRGRGTAGHWEGKSDLAAYFIMSPRLPGDVDSSLFERAWRLGINLRGGESLHNAHIETLERAKELCLHHALTGDQTPIEAIREAAKVEARPFTTAKIAAEASLYHAFQTHNPPELDWPRDDSSILRFSATGKDGAYTIYFEPEYRWIVEHTTNSRVTDERRFLTRAIARNACAVHSHTGRWFGTLS